MLPFTNLVWREICGFESIEGDFEWKFKPAVWCRFSVRQKGIFSEENVEKITTFLGVILERSKQGGDSWLNRLDNVSGFHQYQDTMLVLLTRKGGIMSIISQFLEEKSASPVFAFAKEKLEFERGAGRSGDPADARVPKLGNRRNKIKPQLSRQLFGEDSVYPETDDVWDAYEPMLQCLIWRYWQTASRTLGRLIDASDQVLQDFEDALASECRLWLAYATRSPEM
ncbi:hypothetical protein FS749_014884 [Ceratobasidium sp. UAMH 11750]|nr:hypothetical protein FS749_014884 [Ceratobasidium sp. UAMH 11750]